MKIFWLSSFVLTILCSMVLLSSPYIARENDSRLYARIVNDQKDRPWHEFIAPKWNGAEHYAEKETPYFRDHLAGMFLLPTFLAKLGLNGMQTTYVSALFYRTITFIFFFLWLRIYLGDLYAALIVLGLQLNPQNMNYTLRANHESLLLMFIAMGVWANNTKRFVWTFVASLGAYLTKGLPGLILPGILMLESFIHERKILIPGMRFLGALLLLAVVSWGYEQWFMTITGHSFFEKYVMTQIMGRAIDEGPKAPLWLTFFKGLGYYSGRLLGYALPWTLGIFAIKKLQAQDRPLWQSVLCVVVPYIFFFSFFSRTASRYIFPAFYFAMLIGLLALLRLRPLPQWLKLKHVAIANLATYGILFVGSLISNWDNYLKFPE